MLETHNCNYLNPIATLYAIKNLAGTNIFSLAVSVYILAMGEGNTGEQLGRPGD